MTPNTLKFIEQWGEDLIADVLLALSDKGKIATGRLYLSLRKEEKQALDEIRLEIKEEHYGKYVDGGRRAGKKMPPLANIKAWCKVKGIPEKYAWPIAQKIAKEGIKPTNYFKVPLSVRLALLETEIVEPMKRDLILQIQELTKKINTQDGKS